MKPLVITFFLLFCNTVFGQDTLVTSKPDTHSVKKAVILSSCLPGAGQIYNHLAMPKGKKKAFWKVPLIYAGLGATGYFLVSNQIQVNRLKQEYTYRYIDSLGIFKFEEYELYDQQGILSLRNEYQNLRDLSILAFTAVYILQIVDAGVEAHFVNFDVSEDLSMHIQPQLMIGMKPGVGVTFKFR